MKQTSGFTLMEILVTLTIIAMAAVIATAVISSNSRDEESYQATLEIMGQIRQALLGVPPTHLAGERRYLGYIADMGELPELFPKANNQPAGLWTDQVAAFGDHVAAFETAAGKKLPPWKCTADDPVTCRDDPARLWIGWHGPYIDAPAGVLRDGWGNPLIFERYDIDPAKWNPDPTDPLDLKGTKNNSNGLNLRIKSLGSDGVVGGAGYRADFGIVIRAQDYLGSVAGYLGGDLANPQTGSRSVKINYPSKGILKSVTLPLKDDGYFFSGDGTDSQYPLLPLGTRSLNFTAAEGGTVKTIVFSLEPTANFAGTLR